MLETFHARVDAGMEATFNGEEACPCSIFPEVTTNDDLMGFLYTVWNGALMALVEHLPTASRGAIAPANPFAGPDSDDAAGVVERLANGPDNNPPGPYGEALRHVIVLAAAAGHAAALDTEAGIPQSSPSEDEFEEFLRSLMGDAVEIVDLPDDGPDDAA